MAPHPTPLSHPRQQAGRTCVLRSAAATGMALGAAGRTAALLLLLGPGRAEVGRVASGTPLSVPPVALIAASAGCAGAGAGSVGQPCAAMTPHSTLCASVTCDSGADSGSTSILHACMAASK